MLLDAKFPGNLWKIHHPCRSITRRRQRGRWLYGRTEGEGEKKCSSCHGEHGMCGGRWFQLGGTTGPVTGAFAKSKGKQKPFVPAGVTSAITSRARDREGDNGARIIPALSSLVETQGISLLRSRQTERQSVTRVQFNQPQLDSLQNRSPETTRQFVQLLARLAFDATQIAADQDKKTRKLQQLH